jgi:lactose/L-arabinose transport system ATP-binding protein
MVVIESKNGRELRSGQALQTRFDASKALLFSQDGKRIYAS